MSKSYIELKLKDKNDYNIYVINGDKRIKLSNSNMLIMSKIIRKYPHKRINENIIIYPDLMPIMIKFYREKSKQKKKKVNRKKSKELLPGVILTLSLYAMIKLMSNDIDIVPEDNTQKIEIELDELNNNLKITEVKTTTSTSNDSTTKVIIEEPANNNENITEIKTKEEKNISTYETNKEENIEKSETKENTNQTNKEEPCIIESCFYYYYDTPGDQESLENASQYMDIFKECERKYGVDANLLCAIAAQESSGIHKEYSQNGHALGLMQIEDIWAGKTIKAFNFETNSYETTTIDYEKLKEVKYCVDIAAMIQQINLDETKKNFKKIPSEEINSFATQKYNMGYGNMGEILSYGNDWMNNRDKISAGDPIYLEHVISRYGPRITITNKLPDATYITTYVNTAFEKQHVK